MYVEKDAKQPDGNPNPLICGIQGCGEPGLVWLNQKYEAVDYANGVRVFSARPSQVSGLRCKTMAKIRVK